MESNVKLLPLSRKIELQVKGGDKIPEELWDYLDYLEGLVRDFHNQANQIARKVGGVIPDIGHWE